MCSLLNHARRRAAEKRKECNLHKKQEFFCFFFVLQRSSEALHLLSPVRLSCCSRALFAFLLTFLMNLLMLRAAAAATVAPFCCSCYCSWSCLSVKLFAHAH